MKYKRGDIVIIGFSFSNLSRTKKRPALIISNDTVNKTGDYLMVQVTSKIGNDRETVKKIIKQSPSTIISFLLISIVLLELNQ